MRKTLRLILFCFLDAVFDLLAHFFNMALINRVGRRLLLTATLLLAGISLLGCVVVNEYAGSNESKFDHDLTKVRISFVVVRQSTRAGFSANNSEVDVLLPSQVVAQYGLQASIYLYCLILN